MWLPGTNDWKWDSTNWLKKPIVLILYEHQWHFEKEYGHSVFIMLFEGNQEVIKYILDNWLSKQSFYIGSNFGYGEFLSNERERFGLREQK